VVTAETSGMSKEVDFFFLLDVSGSMSGYRLGESKRVFSEIVFEQLQPSDRMYLSVFDTKVIQKLGLHPVRRIRDENNEVPNLVDSIRIGNATAFYDAVFKAYENVWDKSRKSVIVVLTDGEDNSSKHTYDDCMRLANEHANVSLNIVQIGNVKTPIQEYANLCKDRGIFRTIEQEEISTIFKEILVKVRVSIPVPV
jgi:uncharacterized protein with von Willebrand factor type A (vWA) domain